MKASSQPSPSPVTARKRKARSGQSAKTQKKRSVATANLSLDEVRKAAIQRAKARTLINIHAPDPEQDSPPGETEDERRRRKERINGRRKRAKKIIEIEQLDFQVLDLATRNETLKAENKAFRERLAEAKRILEQGGTLTPEFLCWKPVQEKEVDVGTPPITEDTKMPPAKAKVETVPAESQSGSPNTLPYALSVGITNRAQTNQLTNIGAQPFEVNPQPFPQMSPMDNSFVQQALLGSVLNLPQARQSNLARSLPPALNLGLQPLSVQQQLAQFLPQTQLPALAQLPPHLIIQLLQQQLPQTQISQRHSHPRLIQPQQNQSAQGMVGIRRSTQDAPILEALLMRQMSQQGQRHPRRPDAPEEGKR